MKRDIFPVTIALTFAITACACSDKPLPNRTYFLEGENRGIFIPAQINDSITANLMFDTGASYRFPLELTSEFCGKHPSAAWSGEPVWSALGDLTGWQTSEDKILRAIYDEPIVLDINNRDFVYNTFGVTGKSYAHLPIEVDGVVGFPTPDTTLIWELNFDEDYLEIHDAERFVRPGDCHWLPLITDRAYAVCVRFPIRVTFSNGTTVTMEHTFVIDTGMTAEIALLKDAPEIPLLESRDDEVLLLHPNGAVNKRYEVSAELFDGMEIDSLRIYTYLDADKLGEIETGVIGMNFLKRFNVFFDFGNKRVGFQPVGNYRRVTDHSMRRYYFASHFTPEGRQAIDSIAGIKRNPFRDAGLRAGDEIVAVNGITLKDMTAGKLAELRESRTKTLDILRDGEPVRITVHLSEEDIRGE